MGRRRKGRQVNGLLVLDKPGGITSNSALQRAKRLFGAAKAGHTGSLDPLATGVLPLCFGEATKFSQFLLDADKAYTSTFVLGVGTDTADADGTVIDQVSASHITTDGVIEALTALTGQIDQIPPMYSALKVDGRPLYKLARAGEHVEREARPVTIRCLDLLAFHPGEMVKVDVDVLCSKGTYIRVLAEDLGAALGVPAHVSVLRRSQSGPFDLSAAVSLDELSRQREARNEQALDEYLAPVESCMPHLPRIELSEAATFHMRKGRPVVVPNGLQSGMVRIADAEGGFLGVGRFQEDGKIAPMRLLSQ